MASSLLLQSLYIPLPVWMTVFSLMMTIVYRVICIQVINDLKDCANHYNEADDDDYPFLHDHKGVLFQLSSKCTGVRTMYFPLFPFLSPRVQRKLYLLFFFT